MRILVGPENEVALTNKTHEVFVLEGVSNTHTGAP